MKRVCVSLCLLVVLWLSLGVAVTIIDDLGRVVEIASAPQRVVVAAPAITDFLVQLSLDDRIVGVTDYDSYETERIGQLMPLNREKILSLRPDLVLMGGGFQAPEVEGLDALGLKTVVLNPLRMDDIYRTVQLVSVIFGIPEEGQQLAHELRTTVEDIAKEAYTIPLDRRKKVFFAMFHGDEVKDLWTCGYGSLLNELIALAGGVNITGHFPGPSGWLPIAEEFVAKANPDIILLPIYFEGGETVAIKALKQYQPWADVKAIRTENFVLIDGNISSQPNTLLVNLLEELFQSFYPGR